MKNHHAAFSLVELLVVLGLGALLVAFLAGGLSRSVDSAKGAKCLNNLKQIGIASQQYVADSGGFLPQAMHYRAGQPFRPWATVLLPYLPKGTETYKSPLDQTDRSYSYAISDYLIGSGASGETYTRLMAVPAPSETLFFAVASKDQFQVDHFHFSDANTPAGAAGFQSEVWVDLIDKKSSNYLFLDGHVARLDWPAVRVLIEAPGSRFLLPEGNPIP